MARNVAHVLLRIVAGLLFFQIGAKNVLGWYGGTPDTKGIGALLTTQMGIGGLLELIGGALILLGLFTRPFFASSSCIWRRPEAAPSAWTALYGRNGEPSRIVDLGADRQQAHRHLEESNRLDQLVRRVPDASLRTAVGQGQSDEQFVYAHRNHQELLRRLDAERFEERVNGLIRRNHSKEVRVRGE
jgi:hypothetical protein